jgi:hypothetical protein
MMGAKLLRTGTRGRLNVKNLQSLPLATKISKISIARADSASHRSIGHRASALVRETIDAHGLLQLRKTHLTPDRPAGSAGFWAM